MPLRPLKLLVVDDHPIVRAGVRTILERRSGWTVCAEADNGHDAVRLALELVPDIVIMDYSLPGMNGLEATRQMRRALAKTEILIYSMHDDGSLIRDVLKAGARGYVLKSDDESEIIVGVEALIRGKSYFPRHVAEQILNDPGDDAVASLTPRERAVVQCVAQGQSNKDIAVRLGVSTKTVDSHRTAAMRKLKLRKAVELARYAIRTKLIQP
jgi:DNA-binding NarL/FixJ family response regulator